MNLGNVIIFGDSYSTYAGHIPQGYAVYYSGKKETPPDLMDVSETWWHQVMSETGSELILNNSWSGSTICYTGYNGKDCSQSSSFIYRLNKLIDEGFFKENKIDTVFVFGGTNDSWANSPLGELKYESWEKDDLYSVLPAVCYFLDRLKRELPNARIICVINSELKPEIIDGLRVASEHYGALGIELHDIEKIKGHPTAKGMESIKDQVLDSLK